MNKKKKTLIILSYVLIGLCVLTIGVNFINEKKEDIKVSGETFISVKASDVTAISWSSSSSTMSFTKDGSWTYDKDETLPVDQDVIDSLVAIYKNYGAAFKIEDVDNLSTYGLNNPVLTVTITSGEESVIVKYGDYSKMDQQRYVSIGDGNVYLAVTDPTDDFDLDEADVFLYDETPDVSDALYIKVNDTEIVRLEDVSYSINAEDLYFYASKNTYLPLDNDNVDKYLSKISSLSLSDYVCYNASTTDLSSYGLDNPEYTITIDYVDAASNKKTLHLYLGLDKAEQQSGKEASETTTYIRVEDSEVIYKLDSTSVATLTTVDYDTFRHQNVFTADFSQIYQIDVALDSETYTLVKSSDSWTYNETEVDLTDLEDDLTVTKVAEFDSEAEGTKEEISFVFYLNNENYPTTTLKFYRLDSSNCVVEIDDEIIGKVTRSTVVDIIEKINTIILN